MNNSAHEACSEVGVSIAGASASDTDAISSELRALWLGLTRTREQATLLDRQAFWVLSALECGPRRMSSLAESTRTSQASLTGIVDRLEDHGFVVRVRSCEDRRVVEVSLVDAGKAELDRARICMTQAVESTMCHLTAEERAAFLGLLRKLNAVHEPATKRT